jgi:D-aminopeptidase
MKRFSLLVPSPAKASKKTSVVRHMWRHSIAKIRIPGKSAADSPENPYGIPFGFVGGNLNE